MRSPIRPVLGMAKLAPLFCCCLAVAQQGGGATGLSLTSIVQGMEKSQSEVRAQNPYQVIREYRLSGAKSTSANADVVAQVDINASSGQTYNIQKWSGSSRGREIVKRVLDHEAEAGKGNRV